MHLFVYGLTHWLNSLIKTSKCRKRPRDVVAAATVLSYLCISDLVPPDKPLTGGTSIWHFNENHDGHQRASGQVRANLSVLDSACAEWGLDELQWKNCWYDAEWLHSCAFMWTSLFPRYNAVWIIFFILGLGTLLPWNFFMTATMVSGAAFLHNLATFATAWTWEYNLQPNEVNPQLADGSETRSPVGGLVVS